jgi:DNA-binding NarL/FixJ family response regulator
MSRASILIVDDDERVCRNCGQILRDKGYKVAEAHNVAEARELVQRERFDVIFLDIRMPGGRGDELFPTLEALPGPKPAVAITSGYLDSRTALRCYRHCSAMIPKPLDAETLLGFAAAMTDHGGTPEWLRQLGSRHGLTRREIQVAETTTRGLTDDEAAAALRCKPTTIRTHWHHILKKTSCRNQRELLTNALGMRAASA